MHSAAPASSVVPWHQRWIMLFIQIASSLAMTASFLRIVNQQLLPVFLLVVPCSLFIAIFVSRMSLFSVRMSSAVVGLTSGVVAGVLSEIVVDDLMKMISLHERHTDCKFCLLELLHSVVIVCLIMYCFYLSCICIYDLRRIFLLIVLLFSVVSLYTVFRLVVREPLIEIVTSFVMMVYFVIFRIFGMPLKLQLWFLWLVMCFVSCYWQICYLDSLHLEWNRYFFPVPGSAIGMSVSFLLSSVKPKSSIHKEEFLFFAVILHVAGFVTGRILPTAVRTLLDFLSNSITDWPRSDFWLCTLGLSGFLFLFIKLITRKLPVYQCFVFIVLILVTYVCMGVVNGLVTNGYFIDEVIALSLIMIMVIDDESAEGVIPVSG